jgi:hypothetical protein
MNSSIARRSVGLAAAIGLGAVMLAACSSSDDATVSPPDGADAAMVALCDEMVAQGLSPEEADALAVENGYVTRVGSVDGEGMAVTMDYREDRFTFDVVDGVVTACQYG